jgi:hypothetical protein
MQTYNQIIKLNREFAQAHYQIKTFGNGEIYNVVLHDKEEWFEYPLMWMQDLPATLNSNEFSFNFRVHFIAQVAQVKDIESDLDSTNENEVKSDMIQCAQDLLSFWAQDSTYPELDLVKTGVSFTTVTDKFSDRVTGCYVDLRLKQGFKYNKCAIPMSDVPQPPLICLPVDIELNGVSMGSVASGGTYEGNIINQADEQVGEKDGDNWVVNTEGDPANVTVNGDEFGEIASGATGDVPVKYENGDIVPTTIVADEVIVPNVIIPNPVSVELNEDDLEPTPSGETKSMIIKYADDSPVVVTTVTDTANTFVGTIPLPSDPDIYYNKPWYRATESYNDYDEAWLIQNRDINSYNEALPTFPVMQQVDYSDLSILDRLLYNNMNGNKFRFSGIDGGYYNPDDGLYYDVDGVLSTRNAEFPAYAGGGYFFVIDHLTGILWVSRRLGVKVFTANLDYIEANNGTFLFDDMSGFNAPNDEVARTLLDPRYTDNLKIGDRPPWSVLVSDFWTCSNSPSSPSTLTLALDTNAGIYTPSIITRNGIACKHNYLTGTVGSTTVNND